MESHWIRSLSCLWSLLLIVAAVSPARAGTGSSDVIPTTAKPKNGIYLKIDTRGVDANGYRPVRVTALTWPQVPSTADRRIYVELAPNNYDGTPHLRVGTWIEISQNSTGATKLISIPQRSPLRALSVEVIEDGRILKDLSEDLGIPYQSNNDWTEAAPSILFIDPDVPRDRIVGTAANPFYDVPQISGLAQLTPSVQYNQSVWVGPGSSMTAAVTENVVISQERLTRSQVLQHVDSSMPRVAMASYHDLSSRWIDFTCFDIIVVSWTDLQSMQRKFPQVWQAVRAYVATGPVLWVYDVSPQQRADLEELLEIRAEDLVIEPWNEPLAVQRKAEVPELDNSGYYVDEVRVVEDSTAVESQAPPQDAPVVEPTFVWRRLDLGAVVAMESEEFPSDTEEVGWVLNSVGPERWMWQRRHGMSMHRRNDDYWSMLIPGVGRAPVAAFLVLISVFMVVVGPANYWLLLRARRLYLLLVTVPVGAAVFAASLFAYALVSDGFGTRVRVRSFTYLDQDAGRAVSWSRQSYYAGLSPSGGMRFPLDTAIYPVEHLPRGEYDQGHLSRQLVWTDEQVLASGYLPARRLMQYLVIRSSESSSRIIVQPGDEDGALDVSNALGADIAELYVCDSQGGIYRCRRLADGAEARLTKIANSGARRRLRDRLYKERPVPPPGLDPAMNSGGVFGYNSYYYYSQSVDSYLPDPDMDTSLLERELVRIGTTDVDPGWLQPGRFVAFVDSSPWTPLGLERVESVGSFHVVAGKW